MMDEQDRRREPNDEQEEKEKKEEEEEEQQQQAAAAKDLPGRGPWTAEEDLTLINYMADHGQRGPWNELPRAAGTYVDRSPPFPASRRLTAPQLLLIL
jgi:hypothetical protein